MRGRMQKHVKYVVLLGSSLLVLSAGLYYLQITIFNTPRDTFFYLLQDLAFIPVQVLIVSLIIDKLISMREKRAMLEKMNMAIGLFFSEIGTELLRSFSGKCAVNDAYGKDLAGVKHWTDDDFRKAAARVAHLDFRMESYRGALEGLKDLLLGKKDFMLALLQNPNLLEHVTFTDLLRAVFHLFDELASRDDLKQLHDADYRHLEGDIKRAYLLLVAEWLYYMNHLRNHYPYLFSIAVRKNPFDPNASVEVME